MKKKNKTDQLKKSYTNMERIDSLTMYMAYLILAITGTLMIFLLKVNDII